MGENVFYANIFINLKISSDDVDGEEKFFYNNKNEKN